MGQIWFQGHGVSFPAVNQRSWAEDPLSLSAGQVIQWMLSQFLQQGLLPPPSRLIHTLPARRCNSCRSTDLVWRIPYGSQLCIKCPFPHFRTIPGPCHGTSLVMVLTTLYCNDLVTFEFAQLCGSMRPGVPCVPWVHCWSPSTWHSILHWVVPSMFVDWMNDCISIWINPRTTLRLWGIK